MNCPVCGNSNVECCMKNKYKCNNCSTWFEIEKKEEIKPNITWDLVEEQKEINTRDRFDWRSVLGMSLTRAVAKLKATGLSADDTYLEICKTFNLSEELKRRLKIGVAARYGEMATAQSELNKQNKNEI